MIVKYLRQKGYDVFYLQNITDIDDKIINRAKEKGISPKELAEEFENEYLKDMKSLSVDSINKYARATEYIKEIISQVERLLEKGYAYHLKDGIYYDISKFEEYGKLSRRTALQAEDAVTRIDEGLDKRNKGDFCLWKFSKSDEPKWPSPWEPGRPGWHIEDTAITEKYFGPQYDIHGGARDLIFPHHEAEISQMEAISGKKPLVKYWLHTGFLTVGGQKMSKSLGNFITIRNFLKENPVRLTRFFIIKNHYRSPIDYSPKSILQAKKELERIDEFIEKLNNHKSKSKKTDAMEKLVLTAEKKFDEAMNEDFNTPKAIALIFELVNKGNSLLSKNEVDAKEAKKTLEYLRDIDKFFNFIFWEKSKEKIPSDVLNLVKERESYRKNNQWEKADETRKEIEKMVYQVEDTERGPKIKKLN